MGYISIATALTPDRMPQLAETLPTWLASEPAEVVVVIFGQAEVPVKDDRVSVHTISADFQQAIAKNLKIRLSQCPTILAIDADVMMVQPEGFFRRNKAPARGVGTGCAGTCLITREMFDSVGGFDERMVGWGYEDFDFYIRSYVTWRYIHELMHLDHPRPPERSEQCEVNRRMSGGWSASNVLTSTSTRIMEGY